MRHLQVLLQQLLLSDQPFIIVAQGANCVNLPLLVLLNGLLYFGRGAVLDA